MSLSDMTPCWDGLDWAGWLCPEEADWPDEDEEPDATTSIVCS